MPTPSPHRIGLLTAVLIVVGNMVGTGVFASLGFQLADLPSGFVVVVLWLCGGVIAFCGALSYAELAAMFPRSGGEYQFLTRIYHPAAGFLTGWLSITVGFAAPVGLASMVFGQYAHDVFPSVAPKAAAVGLVVFVTAVHLIHLRVSAGFHGFFTALKITLILVLIGAGFLVGKDGDASFASGPAWKLMATPAFSISMIYVMFAYEGWNAAAYIAGEVDRPRRNVPLALMIGTGIVSLLYLGVNIAFLKSAPVAELAEAREKVALVAAGHLFGESGGKIMAVLIGFGLISSVSAMTWAGPRVTQAMGQDHRIFRPFSKVTAAGIPALAIVLQAAIVIGLVLTTNYETVLVYVQMLLILSSSTAVLGVILLRIREPEIERPYRVWLFPLPPLVFLAFNAFFLWHTLNERTRESLVGLATVGVGLALYFLSSKGNASRNTPCAPDGQS